MIPAISLILIALMLLALLVTLGYLVKLVIVHPLQAGMLWLLGCLFVPFFTLFFIVTHWDNVRHTVFRYLVSCAITGMFLGMLLSVQGGPTAIANAVRERQRPGDSSSQVAEPVKLVSLDESRAELDELSRRVDALVAASVSREEESMGFVDARAEARPSPEQAAGRAASR